MEPCFMCDNARVSEVLTEDNDYSAICIGASLRDDTRIMFCSGWGKPPRFEVERFIKKTKHWALAGFYYPNYCPYCGRKITEY